jgi:hypothetical protein
MTKFMPSSGSVIDAFAMLKILVQNRVIHQEIGNPWVEIARSNAKGSIQSMENGINGSEESSTCVNGICHPGNE